MRPPPPDDDVLRAILLSPRWGTVQVRGGRWFWFVYPTYEDALYDQDKMRHGLAATEDEAVARAKPEDLAADRATPADARLTYRVLQARAQVAMIQCRGQRRKLH